jgi:ribosome biogenesis SPOUT family RNA methylase Rps3
VDEFDFDRTSVLREQGFARRNLGPMQMTTDTAAMVSWLILKHQVPYHQLQFVDRPEFPSSNEEGGTKEMLIMNFRYLARNDGNPDIDTRVLELALKDREFSLILE